jgi:hypothetical protein
MGWLSKKIHKKEYTILLSTWVIMFILLILATPKNKIRNASVAFLFKQLMTWIFGLLVVEYGLIKYPVRGLFEKSNKASFTFEYFVYPAICAIFHIHYPENKPSFFQLLYYFVYIGVITAFEVYAEKKTKLLKYINWKWYYSSITLFFTFFVSRIFYRWFYKEEYN